MSSSLWSSWSMYVLRWCTSFSSTLITCCTFSSDVNISAEAMLTTQVTVRRLHLRSAIPQISIYCSSCRSFKRWSALSSFSSSTLLVCVGMSHWFEIIFHEKTLSLKSLSQVLQGSLVGRKLWHLLAILHNTIRPCFRHNVYEVNNDIGIRF